MGIVISYSLALYLVYKLLMATDIGPILNKASLNASIIVNLSLLTVSSLIVSYLCSLVLFSLVFCLGNLTMVWHFVS